MSDKKDEMTARLALFKSDYGFVNTWQLPRGGDEDEYVPLDNYVRISEWQDFTFKPLTSEAVLGSQLIALNRMRSKTVNEFSAALKNIDGRIANLRALTGPESAHKCATCEDTGSVKNSREESRVVGEEWSECPDCAALTRGAP